VKNVLIDSVMNMCLGKTEYTYSLEKNVVVIKKRPANEVTHIRDRQKKRIISGTVVDKQKMTLPGVSVYIKGTTIGVVTDVNGAYKLEVPASTKVLVFSSSKHFLALMLTSRLVQTYHCIYLHLKEGSDINIISCTLYFFVVIISYNPFV